MKTEEVGKWLQSEITKFIESEINKIIDQDKLNLLDDKVSDMAGVLAIRERIKAFSTVLEMIDNLKRTYTRKTEQLLGLRGPGPYLE